MEKNYENAFPYEEKEFCEIVRLFCNTAVLA